MTIDIISLLFLLALFAVKVGSEVSLIILAAVAVRAVNHFVPRKQGRVSLALSAFKAELFKKR